MPGTKIIWETFSRLLNRSTKADFLNFDEEISLAKIIPKYSDAPISERLFSHSICQSDDLSVIPSVDSEIWSTDSDIYRSTKKSTPAQSNDSFHRLLEQMLFKSTEKEIQTPEDSENEPGISVTKLHQTLETQLQNLIELIQEKIVCTVRVLDYPIASKAADKVFEQDPVGFTDALCFVISMATKNLAEGIRNNELSLSQPDVNTLRKKFYKLTTCIESLRKTRVKVFSQFNKQVIALLDAMSLNNEFEMDEDRNVFPMPILARHKGKYSNPIISDDSSFDNLFWENYTKIMESLKDDGIWKDPKQLPHGEMDLRWEAWNKDKISCRVSADKLFYLSSLDIRIQLRILFGIIDLAATNVENAEASLKKSLLDFHLAKQILNDFSKNIQMSNLRAVEIQEILKVLRVSVATSVTFLKSIEKTTRMSRFRVSEGIQCLRAALGQKTKKSGQFSYKPNYIALLITIKCGPGISPILKEVDAMSRITIGPTAPTFCNEKSSVPTSTKNETVEEVSEKNKEDFAVIAETSSKVVHEEVEENQIQETTSEERTVAIPQLPNDIINLSFSPSQSSEEREFQACFLDQVDKLSSLLKDNLQHAYNALFLPDPTTNSDSEKMPFLSALCLMVLQTTVFIRPYREVSPQVRIKLQLSISKLNNLASFGNSSKRNLIRKLAIGLRKSSDRLKKLAALLLIVPQNSCSVQESNEPPTDRSLLAEQESTDLKRDIWQIRWIKHMGLVTKNTRTNQVQNYANFSLKSKCAILLDLVEFTHFVLGTVESNLKTMKNNSTIVDKGIETLSKRLEKHLKHHTLALNDQMYFGKIIAKLKQTHKESVFLLGRLSEGMAQVVGILAVLNSYIQVMSVFTHEKNLQLLKKENINSNHVVSKKIQQVQMYINDTLACPLTVHVPIKFEVPSYKI